MNDLISRRVAIDAIDDVLVEDESCKVWFKLALQQLPSAERHGRWIDGWICSQCGEAYHTSGAEYGWNYCPNCGAKMDKDWEEPEINPCRGCRDYNGMGGCKSNGGCGRNEVEE